MRFRSRRKERIAKRESLHLEIYNYVLILRMPSADVTTVMSRALDKDFANSH